MRNYVLILLFIGFSNTLFGQYQEIDEEYVEPQSVNGLHVAYVFTAMLNPWTGYQAKVSYGVADLFQFQLNGGILYGKRNNFIFNGYRIRPAVKLFFPSGKQTSDRFYIGIEYNIRKIKEKGEVDYARFGGAFVEKLPFERITKSNSLILSFGSRTEIDYGLFIETGIGFGSGPLKVTTTQYENAELIGQTVTFRSYQQQGDYTMGNILLHFSIGMRIF